MCHSAGYRDSFVLKKGEQILWVNHLHNKVNEMIAEKKLDNSGRRMYYHKPDEKVWISIPFDVDITDEYLQNSVHHHFASIRVANKQVQREYGGSTWVNYSKTRAMIDGQLTIEASPEDLQKSFVYVFVQSAQQFDYSRHGFDSQEEA